MPGTTNRAPKLAVSVDEAEVAKFTRLAGEWWDPNGKFHPLHRFNPARLSFLRDTAALHFRRNSRSRVPFAGLTLLDIGCGGGLLSEPLARMGFDVLGIDPGLENVMAASLHAQATGVTPTYRSVTAEELVTENFRYDCVIAMEVAEHVADLGAFIQICGRLAAPGGLLVIATINRTLKSLALAKVGAEYVLRWLPPGTHDWNKFITPAELQRHIRAAGMEVADLQGIRFDPLRWEWRLSRNTAVNYMIVAEVPRNTHV
ncbi:MAG: bifunctional 2-polyprenyl-6-hydroxyphenol methylase/3-demethylubiquinol 3-O-methyltransferase UbiG [Alphaproteobacteria bacterium]